MSPRTIAWLPSHPAMGWASMNRCWLALEQQRAITPVADWRFIRPLPRPAIEQPAASALWQRWLRNVVYPWQVRRLPHADLVHVLDHSFADLLRQVPAASKKVATVHDVIPLIDPTGMSPAQVRRFRQRLEALRLADRILCVSDFTRRTLLEHLSLDESRVSVLPNGVDLPSHLLELPSFPSLPRPWILLVGSNLERKNLRMVPEVLTHLANLGIKASILRAGPPLPAAVAEGIRAVIGADHLAELGAVSDELLAGLYQTADALLFPSTLEGFGLPVLEAMAHGCPVVCANTSSLPEVGGDSVLYFDPQDAQAAAAQCHRVCSEPALVDDLRQRGKTRAAGMTWNHHWIALCDVYRGLLN